MKPLLFTFLAIVLVSACQSVVTVPSGSPTPTPASVTQTPEPSPTVPPTPVPHETVVPTIVPTNTPSATPTSSPVPTVKPTTIPSPTPTSMLTPSIAPVTGFTPLKASPDTLIIYVSDSKGLDTNDGKSMAKPVKTLTKGMSLLRSGFPDWMLLKRGDTFNNQIFGSWTKSGRNLQEPMVVASYSDPVSPSSVRPELKTGHTLGSALHFFTVHDVVLKGIYFHSNTRDPYSPDYAFPAGVANAYTNGILFSIAKTDNILIEDCEVNSYGNNMSLDTGVSDGKTFLGHNIKVRRNIIRNAFSNARSQGMYAGGLDGLLIEENIFDHNGWTEKTDVTKTWNFVQQNHNIYLRADNGHVRLLNNVVLSGAGHGIEAKSGGIVTGNFLDKNNYGLSFGLANGSMGTPGGITGELHDNLVFDVRSEANAGGSCFEIGNIKPGGMTIHDNICARATGDPKLYGGSFQFQPGAAVSNPNLLVGISDLTFEKNIVYDYPRGPAFAPGFTPGTPGIGELKNVVLRNNDYQKIPSRLINDQAKPFPNGTTFQNNRYFGTNANRDTQFTLDGSNYGWANWLKIEPTAKWIQITYPDPDHATIEAYSGTTYALWLADELKQSEFTWKDSRMAQPIVKFMKAKFGK